MKHSPVGVLVSLLFTVGAAYAAPVIVSSSLSLSAQGNAGAFPNYGGGSQSYSNNSSTSLPMGAYNGGASGTADWSIPNQPLFLLPPNAHAQSSTTASTALTLSSANLGLSLTGNLNSNVGLYVGFPVMFESASASTTLDFQFTLDRTSAFVLDFSFSAVHGHGQLYPITTPEFSFSSVAQGTLLGASNLVQTGGGGLQWNYSGFSTLAPGTYTLHATFHTGASQDPLGDFEVGSYRVNLSATTIPDHGPVALLLAPALALLAGIAATRGRSRR